MEKDHSAILQRIQRRLEAAYPHTKEALERLQGETKLTFYFGIDPTSPQVHMGHTIPLLLLKNIAQLGHPVTVLIGGFTAQIGDPTGKENTRQQLTQDEVQKNAETYIAQVQRIFEGVPFTTQDNITWLASMDLREVIKLASQVTVQQMLARDMFQERIKQEKPIFLHEFLYPLLHGYDSVAMKTDGEVGGNDQTFNMLVGRELVKELLGKDKIVLTTKLLADPGTGKKMSKSEGDVIAIDDPPQEIRRKLLQMDDSIIKSAFELCTEKDQTEIDSLITQGESPKEWKEELAKELVRMYQGQAATLQIHEDQKIKGTGTLLTTLMAAGVIVSKSEGKTLIDQKGITLNDQVVEDWNQTDKSGDRIRIGKGKSFTIS